MNLRYWAPSDYYTFAAFAFVIDKATNKSIPITVFKLSNPGAIDLTAGSTEALARSNFTYNATDGPATVEVESHIILGMVGHSIYITILLYFMLLLCWGLCLWSMDIYRTVLRQGLEVKDGVTFLPITLIFSVPTIRGLYINLLPFGGSFGA